MTPAERFTARGPCRRRDVSGDDGAEVAAAVNAQFDMLDNTMRFVVILGPRNYFEASLLRVSVH